MSRGLGEFQKNILSFLNKSSLPILENDLLWQLASQTNNVQKEKYNYIFNQGHIKDSFYKSFRRSLKKLIDIGYLEISKPSKFISIEDLIKYYPHITRNLLIREMRLKFIPSIDEFIEKNIYNLKFNKYEVEAHNILELQEKDPVIYKQYEQRWMELRNKLISLLNEVDQDTKKILLKILSKGEQLFSDDKIIVKYSSSELVDLISHKLGSNSYHNQLLDELLKFTSECIYGNNFSHDIIKNKMYLVGNFSKDSSPHLTENFTKFLLNKFPEELKSFPGTKIYEPKEVITEGNISFYTTRGRDTIDPIINKLIRKDVFSKFKFITKIN